MKRNKILPYEQELILAHILKKSREHVLAHPDLKLTSYQQKQYQNMVSRKQKNEPLAYILGEKGFYGLDFKVTRRTLIPRPETEHLIDTVISNLKLVTRNKKVSIIDIGTGSGNIIVSILKEIIKSKLPITNCQFLATDISPQALKIAKCNAKKYKLGKKIKFIKSDLLMKFIHDTKYKIRDTNLIIVANLPYLSKNVYKNTAPDVKNYEPKSALYGGIDGLKYYEKLFKQIKTIITNYQLPVTIIIEFSPEQKTKISRMIKTFFPASKPEFKKDLAGKWRLASFKI